MGEVYVLEVLAHGKKGDPIGRIEGFAVIIKTEEKLKIGDKAQVKITKRAEKFAFADFLSRA